MNCDRAGCGGLLLRESDDSFRCIACSRRIYVKADEMKLCKSPNCRSQTKGAYCHKHAMETLQRSAIESVEKPELIGADLRIGGKPAKKVRGPWSPEERALRKKQVEEKRRQRMGITEVKIEEPKNPVRMRGDDGFAPIPQREKPKTDCAPPKKIIIDNGVSMDTMLKRPAPLPPIIQPVEITFRIGKDASSWFAFASRWKISYESFVMDRAYESREEPGQICVVLIPKDQA